MTKAGIGRWRRREWTAEEDTELLTVPSLSREEGRLRAGDTPMQRYARKHGRSYCSVQSRRLKLVKGLVKR